MASTAANPHNGFGIVVSLRLPCARDEVHGGDISTTTKVSEREPGKCPGPLNHKLRPGMIDQCKNKKLFLQQEDVSHR